MYGCSHLECLCGAHWCWGCQKPWDGDCTCYEDDDYYSDEDVEAEDEAQAAAGPEDQST